MNFRTEKKSFKSFLKDYKSQTNSEIKANLEDMLFEKAERLDKWVSDGTAKFSGMVLSAMGIQHQ